MTAIQKTLFKKDSWQFVKDGNPQAFDIFRRHYSFYEYSDGRRRNKYYANRFLICGPGEKMLLLMPGALFIWRKFIDQSGQTGINCAAFRNETKKISSKLILAAEKKAAEKWPGERFYTYVNPGKIKSTNPGYCFLKAGWEKIGKTKKGLIVLAKENNGCLT